MAFAPGIHAPLREDRQPVPKKYRTISETVPDRMPIFTSTPIAYRHDQSCNSTAASYSIYSILSKIDQIDSGIKSINRGPYMSAHVLLNLLNELGKEIKCEAY